MDETMVRANLRVMDRFKKFAFGLFTWKGRVARTKYAFSWFILFIPSSMLIFYYYKYEKALSPIILSAMGTLLFIMVILLIFNNIKRLHDLGFPGFIAVIIIGLVFVDHPIIMWVFLAFGLLLWFIKGNKGPNKYGEDPL